MQSTPAHLKDLDRQAAADNIGICLLDGPKSESVTLYNVNPQPEVRNTVFVYKDHKITARFVNLALPADAPAFEKAISAVCQ